MSTCPLTARLVALLDASASDEALEEHLAGCPQCQLAVLAAAGSIPTPTPAPPLDEPSPALLSRLRRLPPLEEIAHPAPPPHIPGFEILEEIGHGGTAIVYRARQIALDRIVALKVLRPEQAASDIAVARGRRGVEVLASISHPGIVRVFHAGRHGNFFFVAQEFIPGGSLAQRLGSRPWPPQRAAHLVSQVARAVGLLHQRGWVHRDLKPGNILLKPDDSPVLADFGLARPFDTPSALTDSQIILGTPSVMSPEQAGGEPLSPATDIWALGVLLFHLLTGKPPFTAASTDALLEQLQSDALLPPTFPTDRIPEPLRFICLRCLHRNPSQRYSSTQQLVADLDAFLADRPLPSRPLPAQRFNARHLGRVLRPFVAITVLVLLTVALAGWYRSATMLDATERSVHRLRLDLARMHLDQGELTRARRILQDCRPDLRDPEWHRLHDWSLQDER